MKEGFQPSWQKRWIKLDLPTPESPTNTILNTRSGVEGSPLADIPTSFLSNCKVRNNFKHFCIKVQLNSEKGILFSFSMAAVFPLRRWYTLGNFSSRLSQNLSRQKFSHCETSCLMGVTLGKRDVSCNLSRFRWSNIFIGWCRKPFRHKLQDRCYTTQWLKDSLQRCVKRCRKYNSMLLSATVSAACLARFLAVARYVTLDNVLCNLSQCNSAFKPTFSRDDFHRNRCSRTLKSSCANATGRFKYRRSPETANDRLLFSTKTWKFSCPSLSLCFWDATLYLPVYNTQEIS